MRHLAIAALAVWALAACEDEPSPEEEAARNAAMAERVREANDAPPPLTEIVPDAITYPDMEANDMVGSLSCSYAPGTSMGARVIARETDAYMKIEGVLERFVADPGSRELPLRTRSLYNSRNYRLRLEIETDATGEDATGDYEGTIWLYDPFNRVVFTGAGAVQCND